MLFFLHRADGGSCRFRMLSVEQMEKDAEADKAAWAGAWDEIRQIIHTPDPQWKFNIRKEIAVIREQIRGTSGDIRLGVNEKIARLEELLNRF
jgi:hypothetical protein